MYAFPLSESRRIWYVSDFNVSGSPEWERLNVLFAEQIESDQMVLFDTCSLGAAAQEVAYHDLVDFRGNTLPEQIVNPRVLVKPKSADPAFVVGRESNGSFKIAAAVGADLPVKVDLLIIEMGE